MIFKRYGIVTRAQRSFFYGLIGLLLAAACTVDNDEGFNEEPKTDFSRNNYVMATEDASDVDITTFFSFSLEDLDSETVYDPLREVGLFTNSNPSTSSGQLAFGHYIFSQAKDKKGFSSTPGLYRLSLNKKDQVFVDEELNVSPANLFPSRQIAYYDEHTAYFYNEGRAPYKIQIFDPTEMILTGEIDLEKAIREFRPNAKFRDESGYNLVRVGSFALDVKEEKLYVSVAYLDEVAFNLISDLENSFYVAVVDIATNQVEKIISYRGAKNVGFYVSENKATSVDEEGNLYFCAWGWNQFNLHFPSQVFRVPSGSTDFDEDWKIDIESHFGPERIAQSMIAFNNKVYLHVSEGPYPFSVDEDITMNYYEIDPQRPDEFKKLDIPSSDYSDRMNVFSILGDKLFIAVPNVKAGNFNGFYSIDKGGQVRKEIGIENKYRPTRLYKLQD